MGMKLINKTKINIDDDIILLLNVFVTFLNILRILKIELPEKLNIKEFNFFSQFNFYQEFI